VVMRRTHRYLAEVPYPLWDRTAHALDSAPCVIEQQEFTDRVTVTLRARGVVDCAVVVARYFGGVLLGAGGLTRAYAKGAMAALDAANVIVMRRTHRYLAEIPYPLWDRTAHALGSAPCVIEEQGFTDRVSLTLRVREADAPGLLALLARVTDGRAETLLEEEFYDGWEE